MGSNPAGGRTENAEFFLFFLRTRGEKTSLKELTRGEETSLRELTCSFEKGGREKQWLQRWQGEAQVSMSSEDRLFELSAYYSLLRWTTLHGTFDRMLVICKAIVEYFNKKPSEQALFSIERETVRQATSVLHSALSTIVRFKGGEEVNISEAINMMVGVLTSFKSRAPEIRSADTAQRVVDGSRSRTLDGAYAATVGGHDQ